MLAISAAELLAGGEAGGGPVPPTVPDEEEGLLPVDVALYCAAYDGPGAWKVLENLTTIVFLKINACHAQSLYASTGAYPKVGSLYLFKYFVIILNLFVSQAHNVYSC